MTKLIRLARLMDLVYGKGLKFELDWLYAHRQAKLPAWYVEEIRYALRLRHAPSHLLGRRSD